MRTPLSYLDRLWCILLLLIEGDSLNFPPPHSKITDDRIAKMDHEIHDLKKRPTRKIRKRNVRKKNLVCECRRLVVNLAPNLMLHMGDSESTGDGSFCGCCMVNLAAAFSLSRPRSYFQEWDTEFANKNKSSYCPHGL